MSEEITIRSVGEDLTYTVDPASEFEPEFRERSEPARSFRQLEPEPEPEPVEVHEAPQKPLLLALVDEIVEFLARLWDRLRSL